MSVGMTAVIIVVVVLAYIVIGCVIHGYMTAANIDPFWNGYPIPTAQLENSRMLVSMLWPIFTVVLGIIIIALGFFYAIMWPSHKLGGIAAKKARKTEKVEEKEDDKKDEPIKTDLRPVKTDLSMWSPNDAS
jgi:archaellum biogenesis protein FlaJ (TadC family)